MTTATLDPELQTTISEIIREAIRRFLDVA